MPDDQLMKLFTGSEYTLWVYHKGRLIFRSKKERLLPLLDYIHNFVPPVKDVTVFDRIVGNAAALLLRKAFCAEVYSPLGSQLAGQTLSELGISYHFAKTVPYILNEVGNDICPMEKLSFGKTPQEFYEAIEQMIH